MESLSDKIAVRNLVETCAIKGIQHVVISPGSRNAPLSVSFSRHPAFNCTVIVDERSAAFYALGIAQQTQKTVVIVCTSGTAALNYAPAIAEAYYQKIPLLVLTADRPAEWIDQMDGQTIRQENIYSNYIKRSYCFPTEPDKEEEIWHCNRIASEAIESTYYPENGPVHINIPLREPLYQFKDYSQEELPQTFSTLTTRLELSKAEVNELKEKWGRYNKILVITGLLHPNKALNEALNALAKHNQVAILTETTSNQFGKDFNRSIDRLLAGITEESKKEFQPELLVTIGGPVVSKKIKAFLRENKAQEHWHINASNDYIDTYQSLSRIIPVSAEKILPQFLDCEAENSNYKELWRQLDLHLLGAFKEFMNQIPFSDLKVFEQVLTKIPVGSNVQFANSTAVRYSNLFDLPAIREISSYSNRGTSGIDGTISTAVGAASVSDKITTVISGDLSFFYDSNALWIKPMPGNLRMIIINNQGGNIFRIIEGPKETKEVEHLFEAKHDLNAKHLTQAFGIDYLSARSESELEEALEHLFHQERNTACVLEIHTDHKATPEILKEYFIYLRKQVQNKTP